MSKLTERYPRAKRLPHPDTPLDDVSLLKLLEPYLNWVLAEIDTASIDILICDSVTPINRRPEQILLLTGRAVNVWLRHAGITGDNSNSHAQSESR